MNLLSKTIRMARIYRAYRNRRETLPYPPLRLWVEASNICNLRCVMCYNKDLPASVRTVMRLELFARIVAEARHMVHDIYLHHRGEPLLNPALCDMIAMARKAGLKTRFHTNGTQLDAEKAERLLEAAPDLVSFSVDSFTPAAYEHTRVNAKFEVTRDNILRLAARRRARRLKRPYIVVEKIRFRNPVATDPAAETALHRRFLQAGVDEIIEKEEYDWATPDAPAVTDSPLPCAVCTFPWYAMVICADGTVTPCPQDFFAGMRMGNVAEQSLAEIWNGAPYRDLRRRLATDLNSLPLCRNCDRLRRPMVGGVPLQYMATFLTDQLLGYGRLRRWMGTQERN